MSTQKQLDSMAHNLAIGSLREECMAQGISFEIEDIKLINNVYYHLYSKEFIKDYIEIILNSNPRE